ncbi:MAG: ATP-binding protein, partial [Chloroflexota bacterium]
AVLQAQVGDLAPELVKLAPELAGRLGQPAANPPLSPNEERLRLFDHVARFFERAAAGRGLLLFIDDIHWADQSTLALLNYLLRHLKNTRWMGLACYREVELDRAHPFAAALVDWGRGRLATRLALGRLSQADVGQLLAALFGLQSTSTEFTEAVYRETEGNPFFVEEVIKALIEQGQIYRQDGRWQRGEITELTIPQSIKEAIGRRLDRQSAACVEMLHIAAALGKRFTYSELAAVSNGMDENRLLDGLDEAVSAQLLRSEGGETFAFTHDKIREVLYEEMNPVRRRRLHLRLGQGLEQLFQPGQGSRECSRCDSEVQTLAYHFIEGGDLEKGLEYSQQAAEKARQVFALDDARLFYEHAIECAEALERPLAAARLFEAAGDLDHQRGMYQPAVDAFQRALALLGDDPSAAAGRARIRVRLGTAYAQTGDEQGLQHLLAAIEALDPERQAEELGLAYAQLGRYHHYRAHWDQAIAMLQKALQIVEPLSGGAPVAKPHSGPPQGGASEGGASEGGAPPAIPGSETLMNIYAYLSGAYQQSGRYATSMEWAQRCIELGERTGNLMAVALGYEFLAEDHYATGKWRKGLEYGALDRALGQRLGSLSRIGWGLSAEAYSYNGLGELDKALQAAQACLEIVERSDEERLGMLARSLIVQLYLQMGQFEPAQAELEALRRRAEQGDQGQVWNWYLAAWSTQATELGRWEETLQASDLCEQKLGFRFIINDALAQIQLDRPQAVEQIRGELIEISRDHYGGSTNESPDLRLVLALIAAYQGQPGQAAALFTEAEQLYTAQETRLGLARTLYFRALFHQTAGQPAEASSYIQRALEVSRACGSVLYIEKTSGILRSLSETS